MSDDQLSSDSSDERTPRSGSSRSDLPGLEPDHVEAIRLAEVLAANEQGIDTGLTAAEDPAVAGLAHTAEVLQTSLSAASARPSFRTFHERSRARVLDATPKPRHQPLIEAPKESLLQRWNGLFTSVASAAAAAVATLVVTVIALGGSTSEPLPLVQVPASTPTPKAAVSVVVPAPRARVNLAALSTAEQLEFWRQTIKQVEALTENGQVVDELLLRDLADVGASISGRIKDDPGAVEGTDAYVAWHTGFDSQQVLDDATVNEDAEQALQTAKSTASDAMVVAAQFLTPERMPRAEDVALVLGGAADPEPADEITPEPTP